MSYLKSLFVNFLVVFFADHLFPGVQVMSQAKLPHIGGDLLFAAGVGFFNSLIYPFFRLTRHVSSLRIAAVALLLNFIAYASLKFLPVGIQISSWEGYLAASLVVAFGGFLTNFLEMRSALPPPSARSGELPPTG